MSDAPNPVKALLHALDIMESLAAADGSVGVSELARQTSLSKTAVYNILTTLASRGVTEQAGDQRYRLSWKLFEWSTHLLRQTEITDMVRPLLVDLALRTGETVHLGVLDGHSVIYVQRQESNSKVRMATSIGARSPLYCTGIGRALLAFQPQAFIADEVGREHKSYTPRTITDPQRLLEEMEKVRRQGFAMNLGEYEDDVWSLGVPVRNFEGTVVWALSVAGPIFRLTEELQEKTLQLLREAAAELSRRLGSVGFK